MLFPHFDFYNARKVSTTPEEMLEKHRAFMDSAPAWWCWEAGFRFYYDGGLCVLLGFGGHRRAETMPGTIVAGKVAYEVEFKPPTILKAWFYKGEWFIDPLVDDTDGFDWSEVSPVPQE